MSKQNFVCPETGEKFFINRYLTKHKNGQIIYTDKFNKLLVNPKNDTELIPIKNKGPIEAPQVLLSTQERVQRNSKYFKQRAKKHSQTEEQQYLKTQRSNQEIATVSKNMKNG